MARKGSHRAHRRKSLAKRNRPGSAPGLIVAQESALPSSISLASFGPDGIEIIERATVAQALARRGKRQVLWVHVQGLGDAETIRQLGEVFSLHPLALEDAVSQHQHVKMDQYQGHLFIVARMVEGPTDSTTRQLSIFLTDEVVITLDPEPDELLPLLRPRIEDALSQLRQRGPDFLVYAILDLLLDQYFPVLEQFGEELDAIEDHIFANPTREIIHQVHDIRVRLRDLRRIVWQMRETLNVLMRDPTHLVSDETRTYLRDCHDHAVQLVELLEIDHETCSDLRDVHLSAVSNRMNEIMMVLTVMASTFIPLSFIASLYGMNFNPDVSPFNMPELDWYFGYPFAIGLMAGVAIAMLLYFRKRGWIAHPSDSFDDQPHR